MLLIKCDFLCFLGVLGMFIVCFATVAGGSSAVVAHGGGKRKSKE